MGGLLVALIGLGVLFISWSSFQLPAPAWLSYGIVWLAGVIAIGLGMIDVRLGERRRG